MNFFWSITLVTSFKFFSLLALLFCPNSFALDMKQDFENKVDKLMIGDEVKRRIKKEFNLLKDYESKISGFSNFEFNNDNPLEWVINLRGGTIRVNFPENYPFQNFKIEPISKNVLLAKMVASTDDYGQWYVKNWSPYWTLGHFLMIAPKEELGILECYWLMRATCNDPERASLGIAASADKIALLKKNGK